MQKKFLKDLKNLYSRLKKVSKKKKLIFSIGNTSKIEKVEFYFTAPRIFENSVIFGIVLYDDEYAKTAVKYLDGKVDYIMVDAEKKIKPKNKIIPGNIERRVRENTKISKLLIFKGNDLTVDSIDLFLTYFYNDDVRGLGGKKVAIVGSGNIGSKLALILVERGSKVFIYRRDNLKSKIKAKAFNFLKPKYTFEKIQAVNNLIDICKNTDILIGTTDGKPAINHKMVNNLKNTAIIIDAGKGTLDKKAYEIAYKRNIKIFRTDVTASLSGLIEKSIVMEKIVEKKFNIKRKKGYRLVSQGLLGRNNDIVVDDVDKPTIIYGISNGKGDFIRNIKLNKRNLINKIKRKYSIIV